MIIKTRWFMIEIKRYPRCPHIYPEEVIDKENIELKTKGLKEYASKDRRCLYFINYGVTKGCPFHGEHEK